VNSTHQAEALDMTQDQNDPAQATVAVPPPKPRQQWVLGIIYLVALLFCFWMAISNAGTLRIALAWVVAGIVASQIVVDLGKFSSPEAKAKFALFFRSVAGISALLAAYLLK
jgi:hypothetical protein